MNRWTNRKINISKKYTKDERQAIAFAVVSYIQDRTKAGKGKDNQKWKPPADKYSQEYKNSFEFKVAKSGQKKVNLTLSGDMLDSIDLLSDADGEIRIGIDEADQDHGKAEGNIRGSYGQPKGKKSRSRDFLAISQKEVTKILKDFPLKDDEKREDSLQDYFAALKAAKKLIKDSAKKITLGEIIVGKKEI